MSFEELSRRGRWSGESPARRFVRHFLEMVVAMVAGMAVLVPAFDVVVGGLGWSEEFDRPLPTALVMATTMTIGMALWMQYRRHSWTAIAQMAAAMYLSFVVFLPPFWGGWLSGDALLIDGHVLMLPAMVIAMLLRKEEYTREHHVHRH